MIDRHHHRHRKFTQFKSLKGTVKTFLFLIDHTSYSLTILFQLIFLKLSHLFIVEYFRLTGLFQNSNHLFCLTVNDVILLYKSYNQIFLILKKSTLLSPIKTIWFQYLTWPGFVESQSNLTPALLKPVLVKIVYFSLSKVSMSVIWSEQFENLSDAPKEGLHNIKKPCSLKVTWSVWLQAFV